MDDVREKLRLQERFLFEMEQELTELKHRTIALQTILTVVICTYHDDGSADLEGALDFIEGAVDAARKLDPHRFHNEQVEAHIENLRARKNPRKPDS